jgi:hypothetical protein
MVANIFENVAKSNILEREKQNQNALPMKLSAD